MESNQCLPPEPIRTSRYFCTKKCGMHAYTVHTSYYEYFPNNRNSKYIGEGSDVTLFNLNYRFSIFETWKC